MAAGRAASSVSLTLGVAFITLAAMGGILAGPAILDCAKSPDGFGACLREKVADAGLLPPGRKQERPVLSSEAPAPPVIAETARPVGWIEANAGEYEPAPSAVADLVARPGTLDMRGFADRPPAVVAHVALAAPDGLMTVRAGLPALPVGGEAALVIRPGAMDGAGDVLRTNGPTGDVALLQLPGSVLAMGRDGPARESASIALVPRAGRVVATGESGVPTAPFGAEANPDVIYLPPPRGRLSAGTPSSGGTIVVLEASLEPMPLPRMGGIDASGRGHATPASLGPSAEPGLTYITPPDATGSIGPWRGESGSAVLEAVALPPPMPPQLPKAENEAKEPAAATPHPRQAVAYDPKFPDVIVLPSPDTGANSSFTTLELR